jgi:hypothetical protein
MLVVNNANKSLHEERVVGRIVMTASCSAEVVVRGNARPDASTRMPNRNLQMMAQIGEHARRGRKQRCIETATRKATHLDAHGPSIESAGVPSVVGEVDHLCRLTALLTNDVMG